jgi:serine/threonine-protein kinase
MIDRLGKYEIRRELARGAMGVVYEAYDPLIKRRVALKTIRPDQLEGDRTADMVARFRREAQAAGRLNHPNIVAIYEFDEDAGTSFIAMEFVEGRELKECFAAEERFTLQDVAKIMSQILDALDYSHRQGVVHRDIKPANIFLQAGGTVKVADFGIAHIESSNLTQVGTVVGTPNYMSPEQIMGLPVDGRSDLFSAGVILYQFLTGERPFAGSTTTTMQKVLKEEPLAPSLLNVQLPPAIDAMMHKALAKRADERYQTAREFSLALTAAMRQSVPASVPPLADGDATVPNVAGAAATMHATPPMPLSAAASPIGASGPAAPAPAAALPQRRGAAVAIVAALAMLGIAALAATWWLFPRGGPDTSVQTKASAADAARASVAPVAAPTTTPGSASATPATASTSSTAAPSTTASPASAPAPSTTASTSSTTVAAAATTQASVTPAPPSPQATPPSVAIPPGTLVIAGVGLADPTSPRYAADPSLLQADVRADSKRQLVEKAVMMLLDRKSFASHYGALESHVLSQSPSYVGTIVREDAPAIGKNGLMSMTMQAVVDVDAVRKSLDRMSRDERIELIRASGDPKVAVRISVRDETAPNAPARPSPAGENILKERIQSFGFRTWTDHAEGPGAREADFIVSGEANMRRLSTRLAASGLVITKYAIASWTVKCTDRATGEEIYYNTTLPKGLGSYASEEEALRAVGAKVADQFSRDFFLGHVPIRGRKISLVIDGLPDEESEALIARELIGLPAVITATADARAKPRVYALQIAAGAGNDAIAADIVAPLNAKLGASCFALAGSAGDTVTLAFDAGCARDLRAKLESTPPAGLYGAPPERRKAVIKNPETLRKLMV